MMLPTHVMMGILLGTLLGTLAPEHATQILFASIIGSVLPDMDLFYGTHRKSLHYPILAWHGTVTLAVIHLVFHNVFTVVFLTLSFSFAIHCVADIFTSGLEPRPWERTDNRSVYNHVGNWWFTARYWVSYDGAPTDLILYSILLAMLFVLRPSIVTNNVLPISALTSIAVLYTLIRRSLDTIYKELYANIPALRPLLDFIDEDDIETDDYSR